MENIENKDQVMIKSSKKIKKLGTENQETYPVQVVTTNVTNTPDKDIYFTAATASKKTNAVIKKRIEVLMLNVYEYISGAISRGEYSVGPVALNKEQRNFLENKGFKITLKSGGGSGNTYNCIISWNL